jgi:ABC-type multidrug transport system fused ATPase/permease subunit
LRRIAKYLATQEVTSVQPLHEQSSTIALNSATITWPQERIGSASATGASTPALHDTPATGGSNASTPRRRFILVDLSLKFPEGELSLICGKLGSGKTLLLLALLGEADLLAGQIICPRSPPDAISTFMSISEEDEWIVPNMCAYVPQSAWLQNASIKQNILFNLPYNEDRYQATLEVLNIPSYKLYSDK